MLRRELLLILPLVVTLTVGQANSGYSYYGTSNVRYQRPQPVYGRPLVLPGRPMPAPRPTTAASVAPAITAASVAPAITAAPVAPAITAAPVAPAITATPVAPAITTAPAAPSVTAAPAAPADTAAPAAPAVTAAPETPAAPVHVPDGPGSTLAAPAYTPVPSQRPLYFPVSRPLLPPRPIRPAPLVVAPPLPPATAAPQLSVTEAAPPLPPVEVIQPLPAVEQPEPAPTAENFEPTTISYTSAEPKPILQPKPIELEPISQPIREPAPVLLPEPISSPKPILEPEPVWVPEPIQTPEPIRELQPILKPEPVLPTEPVPQPEPIPEPILQPESSITQSWPISQPELSQQPELVRESEPVQQANPAPQPEPVQDMVPNKKPAVLPSLSKKPSKALSIIRVIPPQSDKPVALPPLLPKPQAVREPDFGRHPQPSPSIYNPPVTYPTQSPSYSYPTPPRTVATSTQTPPVYTEPTRPVVVVTSRPLPPKDNLPPVVTKAPGQFKFDFQCKEGNGYYSVEHECDTYIECKHDRAMKYACPDGLHFNPAAKSYEYPCAYPSEVKCVAGYQEQSPKPTDTCPNQYGFYSMNDGDCSRFIMCQEGLATIMNCPLGLAFNPQTSSCDWPANVPQCNPNVFKDFTCPAPPEDEDGQISDIIYKYRYGSQCKLYVACQLGHPRLLSCERGLSFDDASQSCIDEDYVTDCAVPYNENLQ